MFKSISLAILFASFTLFVSAMNLSPNSNVSSIVPSTSHHVNVNARMPPTHDQVAAEFPHLNQALRDLEKLVNNFPEETPTSAQLNALHETFQTVIRSLTRIADGVTALGTVSEVDGQKILSGEKVVEPIFDAAMQTFKKKKRALQSFLLGFGVSEAHGDLKALDDATVRFYDVFIYASPDTVTCGMCQVKKRIHLTMVETIKVITPDPLLTGSL